RLVLDLFSVSRQSRRPAIRPCHHDGIAVLDDRQMIRRVQEFAHRLPHTGHPFGIDIATATAAAKSAATESAAETATTATESTATTAPAALIAVIVVVRRLIRMIACLSVQRPRADERKRWSVLRVKPAFSAKPDADED